MNASIFFDTSDLYFKVNKRFSRKLSYDKTIWKILEALSKPELDQVHAYGIQIANESSGFISCLKRLNIQTHFKKPHVLKFGEHEYKLSNWSLGIALDVIECKSDVVVIGTGNPEFIRLGEYLKSKDRKYCFLTTENWEQPCITITEDYLE